MHVCAFTSECVCLCVFFCTSSDLSAYAKFVGDEIRFPSVFPIRTILPLRVMLVEPKVFMILERAAWQHNKNIGDRKGEIKTNIQSRNQR